MGDFLRSRRARIGPGDVGLPTYGGRRRVPGLRREELAHLAGVSVDYYVRLEQGRTGTVSDEVLEALARVLRLDDDERSYLFSLAKPARRARPSRRTVSPHLRFLLDAMETTPAYVIDHRTDVLAWNPLVVKLILDFGAVPPERRNWVRLAFEDPRSERIFPDWTGKASETVAHLRMQAALHPDDEGLAGLVAELSRTSERFRGMWEDHNVRERSRGAIRIRNDVVGEVSLHFQTLKVAGEADQWLVAYAAEPGSEDDKALRALAAWSPGDDGPAPDDGGAGSV
ncbi:helix-turn-helix transcriptional regulator [Nocardiopsis sediminis]|uniref:Helix-turn-helix transcriptional regulator n=1 Tax=Nocardiopsis sediminis TaxID=1778267 RepID=A0ABV8FNT1_9ACTN